MAWYVLCSYHIFYNGMILNHLVEGGIVLDFIWWRHNLSTSLIEVWSWHVSNCNQSFVNLCIIVILLCFFCYLFWHRTRTSYNLSIAVCFFILHLLGRKGRVDISQHAFLRTCQVRSIWFLLAASIVLVLVHSYVLKFSMTSIFTELVHIFI